MLLVPAFFLLSSCAVPHDGREVTPEPVETEEDCPDACVWESEIDRSPEDLFDMLGRLLDRVDDSWDTGGGAGSYSYSVRVCDSEQHGTLVRIRYGDGWGGGTAYFDQDTGMEVGTSMWSDGGGIGECEWDWWTGTPVCDCVNEREYDGEWPETETHGTPCGHGGETTIEQGVHGYACGVNDTEPYNSWPLETMALYGPRGEVARVDPDEVGHYQLEADPAAWMLCELGYDSCTGVVVPDGLVECDGTVGPPPIYWDGCSRRDWPLWAVWVTGGFAYDPDAGTAGPALIRDEEVWPFIELVVANANYPDTRDAEDLCEVRLTMDAPVEVETWAWTEDSHSYSHLGFDTEGVSYSTSTTCGDEAWVDELVERVESEVWGIGFGNLLPGTAEELSEEELEQWFGGSLAWSRLALGGDPATIPWNIAAAWEVERGEDGTVTVVFDAEDEAVPIHSGPGRAGTLGWYEVRGWWGLYDEYLW